jgi:transposase
MKEKTKKNVGGRPTTLTEEISAAIIAEVRDTLSINHAAESNMIPRSTVSTWIQHGNDDLRDGKDNIFTRFTNGIKKARAEFVQDTLRTLKCAPKNWQSNAWLLERCCAEDFGKDNELYKQLLDDYKMLMQALIDQNKGVTHGK